MCGFLVKEAAYGTSVNTTFVNDRITYWGKSLNLQLFISTRFVLLV